MTIDGQCYEGWPIAKGYRDDDEKKTKGALKTIVEKPRQLQGRELAEHIFTILMIQKIEISAIRREYILEACERPE